MTGEASPLFAEARNWGVQEMIETWPKAWNRLRVGGRGKVPESSVVEIGFEPIGGPTQVGGGGSHDASVRVARVWPARLERLEFEGEGWPSAMDVPKFATPMVDIRRSRSGPPRGDSDPCHGYTWPARWTQRSLEEVVAVLDADARSCLRARLGAERSWSESELRERFDPLPGL